MRRRIRRGFYNLTQQMAPPAFGLALWFDGSRPAYSDTAGTIPSNPPYGRVACVKQSFPAPAGSWLTANGTVSRAWKDLSAIDLQYGSTVRFAQPVGISINTQNCTWGFSFQQRTSNTQVSGIFEGYDGLGYWGITVGGTIVIWCAGSVTLDTGIIVPPGAIAYGFVRFSPTTTDGTIVVNGVPANFSFAAANANFANGVNFVGSMLSNNYHAQLGIAQVLAYNSLTVDTTQLLSFLAGTAPNGLPMDAPLLAVGGDSISQGATATAATSMFYAAQFGLAGNAMPPRMLHTGYSGRAIPTMISVYPTEVKPFFSISRAKNILAVQCITNSMPCSLASAAAQAALVLSLYYSYCDQAKADGWRVILFTCLPRADSGSGTGFPTAWAIFNADVRANYLAHGHDLCDVSAVAGMSLISDAASGPNFTDQLHPNDLGHALLTPTVQAAIARQLAA